MIGMEPVTTMGKYCLYSGFVKNDRPLSLMLIAPPGEGKSDALLEFSGNTNVISINSFTRHGLIVEWQSHLAKSPDNYYTHLILPDMTQVLMGNPAYVGDTMATIMALTEEGIDKISTMHTKYSGNKLRLGVLTAIVKNESEEVKNRLNNIGLMSRFVRMSYKYGNGTMEKIYDAVADGVEPESIKLEYPLQRTDVKITKEQVLQTVPKILKNIDADNVDTSTIDEEWATTAGIIPREDVKKNDDEILKVGARYIKQMRTLLKSCALSNGRAVVDDSDVKEVLRLKKWVNNWDFNLL